MTCISSTQAQREFRNLVDSYRKAALFWEGTGAKGQKQLDQLYKEMQAWVSQYPQCSSLLPRKIEVYDDGSKGLNTAAARLIQEKFLGM